MYTVPMIKQSCPLTTSSTLGMSLGDPVQDGIGESGDQVRSVMYGNVTYQEHPSTFL
jgi:hypothetical protein